MVILILLVGFIAAFFVIRHLLRKRRAFFAAKRPAEQLMAKYGDKDLVNKIMNREFWEGMTKEQLLELFG